jgi:long-subunit acyl-CoA synthetase (AMP-forming)
MKASVLPRIRLRHPGFVLRSARNLRQDCSQSKRTDGGSRSPTATGLNPKLSLAGWRPGNTADDGKLAIVGDNRPEWAASYLAAACTGIVCVPIDRDLKESEVSNILLLSGAQAMIGDDKHLEMMRASQTKCIVNRRSRFQ